MKSKISKIFGLIVIAVMLALASAYAQDQEQDDSSLEPIQFKVMVTPDTARIGDEITVTIEASHDKNLGVTEPHVDATDNKVVIKSEPTVKSKTVGDTKIDTYTTKLLVFKTGEVELPHFEFFYYDSLGNQNSRMAPIETVFIRAIIPTDVPTDSLKLREIVGPISIPTRWWPYAVGILAVLIIGALVWYFWKRKVEGVTVPEAPPEPPFDAAIRRLHELEHEDLPGKGRFKLFYIELSNILRYYIQGRFDIKAVEATTYELKYNLKHREISNEQVKDILSFLGRSDMIKFAKQTPDQDMPGRDFSFVKKFVTDTKPYVAPVEEKPAEDKPVEQKTEVQS
jgi:hypothetical protein